MPFLRSLRKIRPGNILVYGFGHWGNRNVGTVIPAFFKLDNAVDQGEKSMIFPYSDIQTRIMHRAALTKDDISGFGGLTTVNLNA